MEDNDSKFMLKCRTCDYMEEAEKKDYKVETRDFTRQIRYKLLYFGRILLDLENYPRF